MFFRNEKEDYLAEMNIQTDLVIGDQCDRTADETFSFRGHRVKLLSREERGVGRNRNLALAHSDTDTDIVVFADNDVRYCDGYGQIIEDFYKTHPTADAVIFNLREILSDGVHDVNTQDKRARLGDLTRFGTHAVTARRESILGRGISFSLLFGGGAKYGCGEDSLFLRDCYKKGMEIYLCSETIAELYPRESTWFRGVTEKYIFDKGALLCAMCPVLYFPAILWHSFKHRRLYAQVGGPLSVIRLMLRGAKDYRKTRRNQPQG